MKLDIGAGRHRIEGFAPVDRKLGTEAYPLPYSSGSIDEIRASHVLEHFGWRDVHAVLGEWYRVLRPGGLLRIAVPDLDRIVRSTDPQRWAWLMGSQHDKDDFHRSAWNDEALRAAMLAAGFVDILNWQSEIKDCAAMSVSLNLAGVKPNGQGASRDQVRVKVAAVVSIPRLGYNQHWGSILSALVPLGIKIEPRMGAYWEQTISRGMQQAVDTGIDWILTLDGDSVFTERHVRTLLGHFAAFEDVDALCAIQIKRGTDEVLAANRARLPANDSGLLRCEKAHFGLTLFRAARLAELPKPWLRSVPDQAGNWGPDRVDADMRFWQLWREAGYTLYADPDVRIGHLEEVVSLVDADGQHRRMDFTEWREMERKLENQGHQNTKEGPGSR